MRAVMLLCTLSSHKPMMLQCIVSQDDFERACLNLDKLPTVPPHWRRMRAQNQAGPCAAGGVN
jgi:hypothetical protein